MSDWEPGWAALARATKARRDRLRISQSEVERRGGPSTATQRKIERQYADNITSEALFQMDEGLGWWRGTSQAIVDGDLGMDLRSFAEYVEDAINDTRELRAKGIIYPVMPRERIAQPRPASSKPAPPKSSQPVNWGELDRAFRHAERYESLRDVDPESPAYAPAFTAITDQLSLDTLHDRIDGLDRPRKLKVSAFVDELRQPGREDHAQAPQQVEDPGSAPVSRRSGGSGRRGTSIDAPETPPAESMDKLRKLNGEGDQDTKRSRDDPKSG